MRSSIIWKSQIEVRREICLCILHGQEFLVTKAAIFNFKLSCSSNRFFAVKPPRRILHFPKLSGALPFFSHLDICLADIWRY